VRVALGDVLPPAATRSRAHPRGTRSARPDPRSPRAGCGGSAARPFGGPPSCPTCRSASATSSQRSSLQRPDALDVEVRVRALHVPPRRERATEDASPSTTITCCSCGARCSGLEHLREGIACSQIAILASAFAQQVADLLGRVRVVDRERRRAEHHRREVAQVETPAGWTASAPPVSPRRTPSFARPPASASTRSRSSPHVIVNASPFVRIATSPARCAAVIRNAPAPPTVSAETAERSRAPDGLSLCRTALHRCAPHVRTLPPNCAASAAYDEPAGATHGRHAGIIPPTGDLDDWRTTMAGAGDDPQVPGDRDPRTARAADARSRRADGRDRSPTSRAALRSGA